jgi:Anaphase-promoting complex, subunit 10 (APC10)
MEVKHREVSDMALWSLSTFKPGFGVPQLREPNPVSSNSPRNHIGKRTALSRIH